MFKRPAKPDPDTQQQELEKRLQHATQQRDELLTLIGYLQNAALQMDATIKEHAYLATTNRTANASVFAAMKNLNLDVLAPLPLQMLEKTPGSAERFKDLVGHEPRLFENPTLTAAELLGFRIHTATRLLMSMASGKRVDTTEVLYQCQNDINVLMEHEKARYRYNTSR